MPNHVTNKISKEVAGLLKNKDGDIDFNTVIPMPETLRDPDPQQLEIRAMAALGLFTNPSKYAEPCLSALTDRMEVDRAVKSIFKPLEKNQIDLLISAIKNIRDHGFAYWYPWANHHWGTKWNAYCHTEHDDFETFKTAWSHPERVFIKLSSLNPEMSIKVEYADEDIGSNCGTVIYEGGKQVVSELAPNWGDLDYQEREHWMRFALSITDPENVEKRLAEYSEEN